MTLHIYTVDHLRAVMTTEREFREVEAEFGDEFETESTLLEIVYHGDKLQRTRPNYKPKYDDAFARMNTVCFDFTLTYKRLPDLQELLDEYQTIHGGTEDAGRVNRAKGVIKLRGKHFDPDQVNDGGFISMKVELLNAISAHAIDRTSKYTSEINDNDLAIALYVYTLGSFTRQDDPKYQYTMSKHAVSEMYKSLKVAGILPKRVGCNGNKASAMKTILERANLISCFDAGYIPRAGKGISKKYVVGDNHPRYGLWVQFDQTVETVKLSKSRAPKPEYDPSVN